VAGLTELTVPFAGTVLRVAVAPGDRVAAGTVLLLIESMKMEHVVEAAAAGTVASVDVSVGDAVGSGDVLLVLIDEDGSADATVPTGVAEQPGPEGGVRPELQELRARVGATLDEGRPAATERRLKYP